MMALDGKLENYQVTIYSEGNMNGAAKGKWGITNVIKSQRLGAMNICTKSHEQ